MLSEFADFIKSKSGKDRPAKLDASPRTRPQDEASSSCAGRASVGFAKKSSRRRCMELKFLPAATTLNEATNFYAKINAILRN